jgi:hypothetical protein
MTFDNESEERIVKGDEGFKMHGYGGRRTSLNAIVVSNEIRVTTEDGNSSAHSRTHF